MRKIQVAFVATILLLGVSVAPVSRTAAVSDAPSVVSTSINHSCAVDTDGTLWCWGYANSFRGYLGDGTSNSSTVPVQVGTDTDWVSVSAAEMHSCAIKTNGTLWCWGSNHRGQLGIGSIDPVFGNGVDSPVQVGSDSDWRSVSAASYWTCAIKTDNSLYCWGFNSQGQVGDGTTTERLSPTLIGSDYQMVSGFLTHSCGLKTDGTLHCWGYNLYGGIGDGTSNNSRLAPVQVGGDTDWSQVSAGGYYSCALKNSGTIYCWGINSYGQIGTLTGLGDSGPGVHTPSQVGSDTDWTAVGAGLSTPCATKTDGSLYCWGQNRLGELGGGWGGDLDPHPTPVPFAGVPEPPPVEPDPVIEDEDPVVFTLPSFGVQSAWATGGATWNDVRPSAHSCATTSDDRIYCWGDGAAGALGQGNTTSSKAPLQVALGAVTAPAILADPVIGEGPEVGVELSGIDVGRWLGAPIPTFSYQWLSCSRAGAAVSGSRAPSGCSTIRGATSRTYTPTSSVLGKRLRLAVTARNSLGTLVRTSATSAVVYSEPVNSRPPTVSGTATVGKRLTAKSGTFVGTAPMTYAYQWFACTARVSASSTLSGTCTLIGGANTSTFTITSSQRTRFLIVRVTATNAHGSAVHYSASTSAVR